MAGHREEPDIFSYVFSSRCADRRIKLPIVAVLVASTRVIGEDESGLVIASFGRSLTKGRIIALEGEAGHQAALLCSGPTTRSAKPRCSGRCSSAKRRLVNLQGEVVRSEQYGPHRAAGRALAAAETARARRTPRACKEGAAAGVQLAGEGAARCAVGAAKAEAYRQGIAAVGGGGYTAMQLAAIPDEIEARRLLPSPVTAISGTSLTLFSSRSASAARRAFT